MRKSIYFKMKILLGLVFGIALFSGMFLVSGAEEELFYEPGTNMSIILKCYDTDTQLCSSTTNCYLDVFYPNMTLWYDNVTMQNLGNFFNYTLNDTYTIGIFHASVSCSDASTDGYSTFDFYVGQPSTEVQIWSVILAVSILFGIAVLFFLGFLKIEKFHFKWSFFLLAMLFFVYAINIVSIVLQNEAGSENIRNIFDKFGALTYYWLWFIGGIFLAIWVLTLLASLADRKRIKQAERVGAPMDLNKY